MSTGILAPTVITLQYASIPSVNTTLAKMRMPFAGQITGATVCSAETTSGVFLSNLKVGSGVAVTNSVASSGTSAVGVLNTASYAVTNKALASNVATLTTAAHGYKVGDVVTVNGVGNPFDGTHTITVVGSTTTFSYAMTNANVTSAASSGGTAASKSTVNFAIGDIVSFNAGATVNGAENITVTFTVIEG